MTKKQLDKENLVSSGSQLELLFGITMPTISKLAKEPVLKFPKPAKQRLVGNRTISYYNRKDLEEFLARVDVKKTVAQNLTLIKGRPSGPSVNKICRLLYMQFFKVNISVLNNFGFAKYDFPDDGFINDGGQR